MRTKKHLRAPLRADLTATEAAVLGLLAAAGEASGYDLKQWVDHSVGYFWSPAKSQIYALLPRLVDAGQATRRDVVQEGRPDKQLYRITPAGRRALRAWLNDAIAEPEPSRNPFLLKLFFGAYADRDALLEQVRAHRARAEQLKQELEALDADAPRSDADFFPSLTRRYGLEYARALIRWAKAAERAIAERG